MGIPMFNNEDDYYEYRREKYDQERGFWDYDFDDTLGEDEEKWRIQFDGFTDGD